MKSEAWKPALSRPTPRSRYCTATCTGFEPTFRVLRIASQIVDDHVGVLKDCLGITASYKLTTVKERIRSEMRSDVRRRALVNLVQIPGDEQVLMQFFIERYSKDKVSC